MSQRDVIVTRDRDALGDRAASLLEQLILEAGDEVSLALSGGETPLGAYHHLASRPVPWGRVQVFFTSETCVPSDDEASNCNLAERAILGRIPLRPRQVHRIRGEIDPERAAIEAEAVMHDNLPGRVPSLDVVLLGMNPEGAIAYLYPDDPALEVTDRLYAAVQRTERDPESRVTMTLPAINAAKQVVILAAGAEKAGAVVRALNGDPDVPAGLVAPIGRLTWILTEAAASAAGPDLLG